MQPKLGQTPSEADIGQMLTIFEPIPAKHTPDSTKDGPDVGPISATFGQVCLGIGMCSPKLTISDKFSTTAINLFSIMRLNVPGIARMSMLSACILLGCIGSTSKP